MKHQKNQLDNLLYSASQYDDDDAEDLRRQIKQVQNKYKFDDEYMLNLDENQDEEDDGIVLGNGESVEEDEENWGHDEKSQGREWNHQQNAKYYFREVVGNSEHFSQSLSIHRPDLLQSKAMHENSVNLNLESLNVQNILNAKRQQQEKVNEVLNIQINDMVDKIQKQQCLIKGYKKRIEDLENTVDQLNNQKQQLNTKIKQYHQKLDKKDELFNVLREQYTANAQALDQELQIQRQLRQNTISMEKEIQKLRNIIKNYTDQDRGLLDFNNPSPKRSESLKSINSIATVREKQNMEAQIEKLRRQRKTIQTQYEITKQDLLRKQEKFKNIEEDLKRKISLKEKKIKELSENLDVNKQEILKIRKNNDTNTVGLKERIIRLERELVIKEERVKEIEAKVAASIDEIKKKQEKIKELLSQISDKNKKMAALRGQLSEETARNTIETKLQNQRQTKIEQLEKEVRQLKTQKFNLKRQIENLQKPTNIEQTLKRQVTNLKKDNESLKKQLNQAKLNISSLQKETEAKDDKIREFKKRNDELSKKTALIKKKSEDSDLVTQLTQENDTHRQTISRMTKQLNDLRKKAETNQQMANKLYILQSRFNNNNSNSEVLEGENQYGLEEINQALKEELANREVQIEEMQQLHEKQIQRLNRENKTLADTIEKLDEQIQFKEKSLDYMHQKFVEIEKQNAELKAKRNILHSSFYDDDRQENLANHFYENKVAALEKKIENMNSLLKEKEIQIRKYSAQRENYGFEISQLKNRIKDLQTMAISNQSMRKIAPESLSHEETLDFFVKILRRIIKSTDMIYSLSKVTDFKALIATLWKKLDKER